MWVPICFLILFSSGFTAARYSVADADPFAFLFVRSLLVLPLLVLILVVRARPRQWSTAKARYRQMGVGMLLHGAYLGGVFAAIQSGMPAGLTALLVSMHPLATAALSGPLLGVQISARQWLGFACGAAGAALVLSTGLPTSTLGDSAAGTPWMTTTGLLWCALSLLGISSSTIWQKRISGQMGLVEGLIYQYIGAGIVFLTAMVVTQSFRFTPTLQLMLTLAWLVIAISVGAIWLLMIMLEQGEAHQVSRLFFMVPPTAAFMAWLLFDEQWTRLMIAGAALIVTGLVLDRPRIARA